MVQRSILISSLSSPKFAIIGCTGHDKMKLKGPSQPHLCFCLRARIWLLCFI